MVKLLLLLLIAYLAIVIVMTVGQRSLIFVPMKNVDVTPKAYGWAFEDVYLEIDGETTHGWYVPLPESRATLLFCHGNAGNVSHRLDLVNFWRRRGFAVLVFDYGGYGHSSGKPSEKRCYADGRAMWNWLVQHQQVPPERIVLYGRSLGGGVAAQLATEVEAGALILESTFRSVPRMAKEQYPFLPVNLCVRHRFDTESKLPDISEPVLVMHSSYDTLVPFKHGRHLYELASPPKEFIELVGGHNEGTAQYTEAIAQRIEAVLDGWIGP